MKLSRLSIVQNKSEWEKLGYTLPEYNIDEMIKKTSENPIWVHFGAGNIFRAFPAAVCQKLLNKGIMDRGIIVAEGYDYEIIDKSFKDFDNLTISVTLNTDGTVTKEVIASVAEALTFDFDNETDTERLKEIFSSKSLEMASFTITEKGYNLKDTKGEFYDGVKADFENGPENAKTYMGRLTALLYHRYKNGARPITLVSMDNCSHNGIKLKEAVYEFAKNWVNNLLADGEFLSYIQYSVSYPCSMIDKITPRPSDEVLKILEADGIENAAPVETKKHTFVAPFVNAEKYQYLVIEDSFVGGKPPLNEGGIIYTSAETVDKAEKMKVCTCLNPLHTCLAIYGCLLGYNKISDEMKDDNLVKLIKKIGYDEGLPVVVDPGIISPKEFIDETINERLPNPFIPDAPQRIACDTSQKLPIRFGETIKAYEKLDKIKELKFIPLVLAGWCRYLMGIDDSGNVFEPSPDPMLDYTGGIVKDIEFGSTDLESIHNKIEKLLKDKKIFGVDLYEVGLGQLVEKYFSELNAGPGAVKNTLIKYLG